MVDGHHTEVMVHAAKHVEVDHKQKQDLAQTRNQQILVWYALEVQHKQDRATLTDVRVRNFYFICVRDVT